MVIGICGGSGSGKTTLVKQVANHFHTYHPAVFSLDNYYKPIEEQTVDCNDKTNFDLPTALDETKLTEDFHLLMKGETIELNEYQFNVKNAQDKRIKIKPSEVIIIEGLFLFNYKDLISHLDYIIFIDLPLSVQLERRINRDVKQRGYAMEDVMYQWENHVIPCYNTYVLPHKSKADFFYHSDERSEGEFNRLIQMLEKKLANNYE